MVLYLCGQRVLLEDKYLKMEAAMHDIIRRLRRENGLTQQQVADHLGIDRSTYAYYESGRTRLNVDVLVSLAHFYKVSYATFLGPEPMPAEG